MPQCMYIYLFSNGRVERLQLRKPYSPEARHFIRCFYFTYRSTTTIAQMARELAVPESSMRRILRRLPDDLPAPRTLFD